MRSADGPGDQKGSVSEQSIALEQPEMSPGPVLRLEGISKVYPGVRALDRVSVDFRPGEIHGLVGENGAGKSTLIQVIAGGIAPDEGTIELAGKRDPYTSPAAARHAGISVVFQEFQSLPGVAVTDNVLFGSEWPTKGGAINWSAAHRWARKALEEVGLVAVDVRASMESLGVAQRKLVETARALRNEARVVLLDEPTAALEAEDSSRVLAAMERLRAAGCAVVFSSHRLNEVLEACDRVTVLRDGKRVGSWLASELNAERLAHLMIGRELKEFHPPHEKPRANPILEVSGLTAEPYFRDLDLVLHEGEVVGLAGVMGSGRSEIGQSLFGLIPMDRGEVRIGEEKLRGASPVSAVDAGIAYVPSDRQQDGIVFTLDIERNISLAVLRRLTKRGGVIGRRQERELARKYFERLRVKAPHIGHMPGTLSGGNQQKVLLGRWLAAEPQVLILDEPTQGIDIGAKEEVHQLIADLASQGLAVVVISSDLPELIAMSDRVVVLHRGEVVREFPRGTAEEADVMLAASGHTTEVAT